MARRPARGTGDFDCIGRVRPIDLDADILCLKICWDQNLEAMSVLKIALRRWIRS
jgi:hypothetical protein